MMLGRSPGTVPKQTACMQRHLLYACRPATRLACRSDLELGFLPARMAAADWQHKLLHGRFSCCRSAGRDASRLVQLLSTGSTSSSWAGLAAAELCVWGIPMTTSGQAVLVCAREWHDLRGHLQLLQCMGIYMAPNPAHPKGNGDAMEIFKAPSQHQHATAWILHCIHCGCNGKIHVRCWAPHFWSVPSRL